MKITAVKRIEGPNAMVRQPSTAHCLSLAIGLLPPLLPHGLKLFQLMKLFGVKWDDGI
jgi:hypothetical protein